MVSKKRFKVVPKMSLTYANEFCPFAVLNRGTCKSVSEFLKWTVSRVEPLENVFESYVGARPFKDL